MFQIASRKKSVHQTVQLPLPRGVQLAILFGITLGSSGVAEAQFVRPELVNDNQVTVCENAGYNFGFLQAHGQPLRPSDQNWRTHCLSQRQASLRTAWERGHRQGLQSVQTQASGGESSAPARQSTPPSSQVQVQAQAQATPTTAVPECDDLVRGPAGRTQCYRAAPPSSGAPQAAQANPRQAAQPNPRQPAEPARATRVEPSAAEYDQGDLIRGPGGSLRVVRH